ncbi:MAG: hypothetical protein M1834_003216 [Cirrosporium novae-zelandiae]|nr:MAG: hypothetical protein M1834_003216 [Cirrosporium novae-zelandiae]
MFYSKLFVVFIFVSWTIAAPFLHTTNKSVEYSPISPRNDIKIRENALETLTHDPASAQVASSKAFTTGASNYNNSNAYNETSSYGMDYYNCYYGGWENFPNSSSWISFDAMFHHAIRAMRNSCTNLGQSATDTGDSNEQIEQIRGAIQLISGISHVDYRFILAIILQESIGCVNVINTDNGVRNTGIMQAHDGAVFAGNSATPYAQQASIIQMVMDGTQGTLSGDGLVQCINRYGNIYEAARCYNSGSVDSSDVNYPFTSTASYVNDIANRMTGWLYSGSRFGSCQAGGKL